MDTSTIGFNLDELTDLDRYLGEPSDVAFVSGSQQAGLGNSASDFDLYIVYRDGLGRLKDGPKQFWLQGPPRRVDLERHAWAAISNAAALVHSVEAPTPVSAGRIPFDAIDLYYRTALGVPMANEAGFAELTAGLDVERYHPVFAAWSSWQAGLDLARARQMLEQERPEAAYFAARLALRQTVTAWMASLRHGWPNPKWAFVKLAAHFGRESDEYRRAWALNGLASGSVGDYVSKVAAFCEEHGTPYLQPATPEATVFAWRGEVVETKVAGRAYLVHARRDVYEMDDAAMFICSLIDGSRRVGEVSDAFGQRFGLATQVASYRAGELLHRLEDAGLIVARAEFVMPGEVSVGRA